jgi:hypothetical protein
MAVKLIQPTMIEVNLNFLYLTVSYSKLITR